MLKPRIVPLALACVSLGLLGACDREDGEAAQESATAERTSPAVELTGTLDRSFAGEEMPQVTVTNPAGERLDLGGGLGEPVLLNLWATWCAPCVVEMPLLDDLAGDLGESVRVLTVSEDFRGAAAVEPFFAERGLENLPQWIDAQNALASAYGGGPVLPLTILYDSDGREVWRVIGGYDWASEEARELVLEAAATDVAADIEEDDIDAN
ncbi:TlpA family protein disulfide reductase [Aurantiacibacter spongiae]|uniref:TlpA family protein disulfide reductase n=1 Tax=Aurantiacibacter spongiae TaxID=2488860 RepID=UPI001F390B4F|nr:TlpA disulfide reductase family protein [Aurantiacibacter spongiae]